MRLTVLDGFRGFFLVFMMVHHLNAFLGTTLGKLNHHRIGFVEDAQGFVFISGLVVGLVYGKGFLRKGAAVMQHRVFARMRTIYSHQIGLALILLTAAFLLAALGVRTDFLDPYLNEPILLPLTTALLVSGSMHMGILAMYIWFMAVTPFVLRAFRAGHIPEVMIGSALLWVIAQSGVGGYLIGGLNDFAAARGHDLHFGIYFDLFGWQVLFFGGLLIGWLLANDALDLSWLKARRWETVAVMVFAAFVLFAVLDRAAPPDASASAFAADIWSTTNRERFTWAYLANFAVDLYLVVWLLTAGPSHRLAPIRILAAVGWRIFTWRPLVFLGQHSLHVFSWHILAVYAMGVLVDVVQPGSLARVGLLLLGVASLYIPASFHQRQVERERATREAAAGLLPG